MNESLTIFEQDDVAIVPMATARSRLLGNVFGTDRESVQYVVVKASGEDTMQPVQDGIRRLLRFRHRLGDDRADDFSISIPEAAIAAEHESTRTFSMLILSVSHSAFYHLGLVEDPATHETGPVDKALDVEIDVEDPGGRHHKEHRHVPAYVPWLVLIAIILTYVNIGAYWTYIELSTVDSNASPEWVASMLWISSVFSVIGCLFAVLLSNRYGLARPLLVTLVFQASIVAMLVLDINNTSVALSMFFFNFCWIFVDIYQAATIANVDHSGRFPAMIPAAQGLGNFLGPNFAASVLAFGLGYNGVFIMCAMASIAAFTALIW